MAGRLRQPAAGVEEARGLDAERYRTNGRQKNAPVFCLPFIRYDLGDHGRVLPGPCPCGIPGELLELIGGKKYDFLRSRSGFVHGAIAGRAFCEVAGIHRYQLVQHGFERFTARTVLPEGPDRAGLQRQLEASVGTAIRSHFGDQARIEFEYPAWISPAASGKFRFVIQEMD